MTKALTPADIAKASHDWSSFKSELFARSHGNETGNALVSVEWQVEYDPLGHDWQLTYKLAVTDPTVEILQVWIMDQHPGIWIPELRPWVAGACEFQIGQGVRSMIGGVIDSKWRPEDAGQEYQALLWGYVGQGGVVHKFGPFEKAFTHPTLAAAKHALQAIHPRSGAADIMEPGTGFWEPVPSADVRREFHAYKLRMLSGRRKFRYYYGQHSSPQYDRDKYYENVYAIVELLRNDGTTTLKNAGALVFFDDSRLPRADLNLGTGIALFYPRWDLEPILELLRTYNKGFIDLVEMMEPSGARHLIGQLLFDTPVPMGPEPGAVSATNGTKPRAKKRRASRKA